jgi:undecaprenyl-diphosphatase
MMTKRTQSWILVALAFFGLEMLLILWIDRLLSEYLRGIDAQHRSLIDIFRAYTDLGKSLWYLWPSGIAVIICALGLRLPNMRPNLRKYFLKLGPALLFFFTCIAISGIATDIIKPILGRARPVLLEREGTYGFHPFSTHAVWNGMPSGHATTAFALAFCLMTFWPRHRNLLIALACVLAVSRIIVNAHYLSDVLAGGMVGFLSVCTLRQAFSSTGIIRVIARIFPIDAPECRR